MRCPAVATFPPVEAFGRSGWDEAIITLTPPKAEPITRRAVRMVSPDGEVSVLLTNLRDPSRFPRLRHHRALFSTLGSGNP